MNVTMFNRPDRHPHGMLRGYEYATQKETILVLMFRNAMRCGSFEQPMELRFEHPEMVEDGLLERVAPRTYTLTEKALILLHAHFGKAPVAEVA